MLSRSLVSATCQVPRRVTPRVYSSLRSTLCVQHWSSNRTAYFTSSSKSTDSTQASSNVIRSTTTTNEAFNLPPSEYKPPTKGVLTRIPKAWIPYAELARIEKPAGLYAFCTPYAIGMSYAACIQPSLTITHLASTGALLVVWNIVQRGAACTVNDILDRDFDRKVERCKYRPVARGAVSVRNAWLFYWTECAAAAAVVTQLPHTPFHHAIPIVFLLSVYPLAKRVTDYPQLVLCVPLAWGILMACTTLGVDPFVANNGTIALASGALMLSNAIWLTMMDYVNACQDSIDDVKAGVRSMAVKYQNTKAFLGTLSTAQVSLLITTGYLAGLSPIYFIVSCGGSAAMLALMVSQVNRSKPKTCAWWFARGSFLVGGATIAGLVGEYAYRRYKLKSSGAGTIES